MDNFTENGQIRLKELGIEEGDTHTWEEYDSDDFVFFFSHMSRQGEGLDYYSFHTFSWVDEEDVITGLAIALGNYCSEVYQGERQSTFLVDTSAYIPGNKYYSC